MSDARAKGGAGLRLLAAVGIVFLTAPVHALTTSVRSPDGRITVEVAADDDDRQLSYRIIRGGEVVIDKSRLRLVLAEGELHPVSFKEGQRRSVDAVQTMFASKSAQARDHFNELSVDGAIGPGKVGVRWIFRAYDDGVAFRYVIPASSGFEMLRLRSEDTEFAFAGDYSCHGVNVGRYDSPHEGEFDAVRSAQIRAHHLFDLPLVCSTPSQRTAFAIGEADLRHYGGLYLSGRDDGLPGVRSRISPRLDHPALVAEAAVTADETGSPWRVLMMADRAGKLIESQLIALLNPVPAIDDVSWIRPGKTAWDWWSGPYLPPPQKGGMDMTTLERYVDFAASTHLEYMLIDEGWCLNSGVSGSAPANADVTRARTELDMPRLVDYAAKRGVGLWLWVQWELLDRQMDAALEQYHRWGIKGIKVDFMNRNDQQMVDYYHRLLSKAAAQRLMVDLHGAYPPTGLARTYPNLLTQEGVLGAEYNKWSTRVTPEHNVTLPYTRMLLGPMDYTPGGFRNVTPKSFQIVGSPPRVQTTRGQALAMYVVYDSPLQIVADSPDIYAGADGFEFVDQVPTTWDETRYLAGDIGEYVVLARRKGGSWYVGAMTNKQSRTVKIPLTFLSGKYRARVWEDGSTPTTLRKRQIERVAASSALDLIMAPAGGAVVVLDLMQ